MTTVRYTMLYDGNCRICTSQADLVAHYDDDNHIECLDLNTPAAQARFPQITPLQARRELHLVGSDGAIYRGAEAVRAILLQMPTLRIVGELMRLPGVMSVAHPIYAVIARNRYLIGGRTNQCSDDVCGI